MKKLFTILLSLILIVSSVSCSCTPEFHSDGSPEGGTETAGDPSRPSESDILPVEPLHSSDPVNCKHTDSDDNGICDLCNADVLAVIDFYAINDLHGKFTDTDSQPGVDEMSNYIKAMRMTADNLVILSSGDMWQGSSESNMTKGALMTEWMNEMGFVSMTLGNHEFDWGTDIIAANSTLADFPFLALNIYEKEGNTPVPYCSPSVTIECEGVKVGIIGAIGDCYSSISGKMVEDIYFLTGNALTEAIKKESEKLRSEGCEIIVLSIHDGYDRSVSGNGRISNSQLLPYYDISLSDGYADVVFEGHTHREYALSDMYGTWHLQDGGDNKVGISHVCLEYNKANDTLICSTAEIVPHSEYKRNYAPDAIVSELLEKYGEEIGDVHAVIATTARAYDGDELRQICADMYYEKAVERWGDEYDIVLGGGFFSVRSPGYLPAGEVTYADLQMMFPFDNELVLCEISGTDLNNNFFNSKNDSYFISYGDYGEGVKNAISPNKRYYIVTDTYSSTYAPNRLTELEAYGTDVFSRDLLAEYFAGNAE